MKAERNKIIVFSKLLRQKSIDELVEMALQVGFDGYDLCIRPGHPVNPENVDRTLVEAARTMRRAGLDIGMVTANFDLLTPDHPTAEPILAAMDAALRAVCAEVAAEIDLQLSLEQISYTTPVAFDAGCVAAVKNACQRLAVSHQTITSGAGHDACYVAKRVPTAMLFAPCKDGISHHESESAEADDLEAVCNVLLHAVLDYAGIA